MNHLEDARYALEMSRVLESDAARLSVEQAQAHALIALVDEMRDLREEIGCLEMNLTEVLGRLGGQVGG